MRTLTKLFFAGLLVCLTVQTGLTAETGSAIKADVIKAEPFRDAKTVGSLASGSKVTIVKRDGGWMLISAPKKGWVRMLSIRLGSGTSASGTKTSSVLALASGRAGTGNVVSSTGIRGLNEEDLKNAKFNAKELELAESFIVNKKDAEQFAAKAQLKARSVAYLSE
ncbi:MAG: SH3 domain-containing protein [Thermodesulfovibrionia bacterium]|nr:SH3 domain-containing protein [Thermodesulfovibrionia bacterium]